MILRLMKYSLLVFIVMFGFCGTSYSQVDLQNWSKDAGRAVSKSIKLADSGKHEKAIKGYEKLLKNSELSPHESSSIYQLKGFSEYSLSLYTSAIASFESAIASGGLSEIQIKRLKENIDQMDFLINRKDASEGTSKNQDLGYLKIDP